MYDSTDYELNWSAELLRSELVALCTNPHRVWTASEVELLLTEAFHTGVPAADFTRTSSLDIWSDTATGGRDWIGDLLDHLDEVASMPRRAPTGPPATPQRATGLRHRPAGTPARSSPTSSAR